MKVPTHVQGKLPPADKTAVSIVAQSIDSVQKVSAAIGSGLLSVVAQNTAAINAVGGAIEQVNTVSQMSPYLPLLTANLDNLNEVAANLAPVLNCSNNMATLLLLSARMAEIEGIIPRLPDIATLAALDTELEGVYKAIPQIVTLVAHMGLVVQLVAKLPELDVIFSNLEELVALGEHIHEIVAVANNLTEILKVNGLVQEANAILVEVRALRSFTQALSNNAKASANAAKQSELAAYSSELTAAGSANDALASADAAKASETNSTASATASRDYSDTARNYANAADASRASAAAEAVTATQKASAASTSAAAALVSEGAAKASENAAKASQTAAKTSETNSKTSETNAKASETVAVTKASEASASATTASTKATEAANSATAANTAKEAAELAASTLAGGIVDRGAWSAATGVYPPKPTRPLPGGGTQPVSAFWKVTAAGTVSGTSFAVGDDLRYSANDDSFYKVDNSDAVTSVQGKLGEVILTAGEVGALQTPTGTHNTSRVIVAGTTPNSAVYSAFTIDKSVPANAAFTDTVYTHPNSDGNRHVPASGTSNNRKFLMATATAGSYSWTAPTIADITGLTADLAGKLGVAANAASASKLATPVTINGVSFDGSANISITAPNPNTLTRGVGLLGADYSGGAAATWRVAYGTSAGTAAEGNDPRLSDARTPLAHSHTAADVDAFPATGGVLSGSIDATGGMKAHNFVAKNAVQSIQTAVSSAGNFSTAISAESGFALLYKLNKDAGKASEFIGIDPNSDLRFRKDNGTGDSKYTDHHIYHSGKKPSASDIGALPSSGGTLRGAITFASTQDQINHQNPTDNSSVGIGFEDGWLRYRFGGTGLTTGIRIDNYDIPNLEINRMGTMKLTPDGAGIHFRGPILEVESNTNPNDTWQTSQLKLSAHKPIIHFNDLTTNSKGGLLFVNDGVLSFGETVHNAVPNGSNITNAKKVYHEGFKPTAADVGALPLSGGTLTGDVHAGVGSGFYPNVNNASQVGNANWRFEESHINRMTAKTLNLEESLLFKTGGCETLTFSNWVRTTGNTGWLNTSHNGGWFMNDATWIRAYSVTNKLYISNVGNDSITTEGGIHASGTLTGSGLGVMGTTGDGKGLSLYGGANDGLPEYGISFATTARYGTHGETTGDWATYFTMTGGQDRGWIFKHLNGGNVASINAHGVVTCSRVNESSDKRVKTDIKNIPDALNKVLKLNGVTYTRIDQEDVGKVHTGLIAQEVEAVLPEAVSTSENGDIKDFKSVAYGNLVGLLVEAIKEQQQTFTRTIEELQKRIELLETK